MLTEEEIRKRIENHIYQLKTRNVIDDEYTRSGQILRARICEAQEILELK